MNSFASAPSAVSTLAQESKVPTRWPLHILLMVDLLTPDSAASLFLLTPLSAMSLVSFAPVESSPMYRLDISSE